MDTKRIGFDPNLQAPSTEATSLGDAHSPLANILWVGWAAGREALPDPVLVTVAVSSPVIDSSPSGQYSGGPRRQRDKPQS